MTVRRGRIDAAAIFYTLVLLTLPALCWTPSQAAFAYRDAASAIPAQGTVQAAFSPWDDVETLMIDTLAGARHEILMQAYLLTSKRIVAALRLAQQRGVRVAVLLDDTQVKALPLAQKQRAVLLESGVEVWGETAYGNAHNKVIVIDADWPDVVVITGSYNFTWSAQHKNAENILILRGNPALAASYASNWRRHRKHASRYD